MRVLIFAFLLVNPVAVSYAECRIGGDFTGATHLLVNGSDDVLIPEIVFDVPENRLGDGNIVISDTVNNGGSSQTLANHVRFRLQVARKTLLDLDLIDGVTLFADSSTGLSCTNCASSVTIPFSKIGWNSSIATESRGLSPTPGTFSGGTQQWLFAAKPLLPTLPVLPIENNNVFNLQFHFANDEIYPAGTYKGQFLTRGVPQ